MKKILGLDLGTNSIGWALVNEAENENETSKIIKLGVRVNPLTVDEKTNFEKGKPISTNADRTLKRGVRRNLQRFKLRRSELYRLLSKNGIIGKDFSLAENGKHSTHQTLKLRAKAAKEEISLENLARVLFALNKKRGYKSNRKSKNEEDGEAVDDMAVAKDLYDKQLTPGQYALSLLEKGKKHIPDFYRSDLQTEFDTVWRVQKQFYPDILSEALYKELQSKNKKQTWAILKEPMSIVGKKLEGNPLEQKKLRYQFRVKGLSEKLDPEYLAIALQEINNDKKKSSGYLGKISDRSKILYTDKKTVGEYLWGQVKKDPHTSLKNQVFYRQDYLDEFERIWETQAKYHKILTPELKEEIRDTVIFYQRRLKSQKGLISFCQFEKGHRVIPRSCPLFQEFKIWQNLNNLEFTNKETKEVLKAKELEDDIRNKLFDELNLRGKLKPGDLLKTISNYVRIGEMSLWECNYEEIQGNETNRSLFDRYQKIMEAEGYGFDWEKKTARKIKAELRTVFPTIDIYPKILDFDALAEGNAFDKQTSYQLWHLLYSAEDDEKTSEKDRLVYGSSDVNLKKKLHQKFGFKPKYAKMIANTPLQADYGNLSARAIRKILPFMQSGNEYSDACTLAGYNHSHSLTREELAKRELKSRLEILPKNSLRNPVVEKILNQMVNLVNQVCDEYGKPDEIRIELARELKKSAKEREKATKGIADATKENDSIREYILKEFRFIATRNDVIRYRLWKELEKNGHRSLFTNQYIPKEKIFSKDIEIEHIIPKALLFDDSFSNKTLAYRKINLKKRDRTAFDFISQYFNPDLENYKARIDEMLKQKAISKGKHKKLLLSANNLPDGFIERDLRNSQYIAKKAKNMLQEVFKTVVATTGSVTDKLREDWELINVMKELNLPKYKALGLTEKQTRWDNGQEKKKEVEVIKDWTKRNDHRHHAMDALTVAFTSHSHIQYINYMNAKRNEKHKEHKNILAIENIITEAITKKSGKKSRKYLPPMRNFREEAKKHIEAILISFKTKNKVVTQNVNTTKTKKGENTKKQLTPRGQLHKETVYGKRKRPMEKPTKLDKKFTPAHAEMIIDKKQKEAVLAHLAKHENKGTNAFDTKILKRDPLVFKNEPLKEVLCFEEIYTIRKPVNPENFKTEKLINKVIDGEVRKVLSERLKEYNNDAKKAFSDLEKNPIWLNKAKGISIKRATITGVSNAEPLHLAKDHFGHKITDEKGKEIPVDYVSIGNNHHLAVYINGNGKLEDRMVSFYEAVARVQQGLPIVDKGFNHDEGWKFLFTIKQNEMFVFPNEAEGFDPNEIDLLEAKNATLISRHLFRVQKISKVIANNSYVRDFVFRHHLETRVNENKDLKDINYKQLKSLSHLKNIVKVRINHLGQIVQTGEY